MKNNEALQTVQEIRSLMEKSSKFLSFSGTSTILIGIYALIGAAVAGKVLETVKTMPGEYSAPQWLFLAPNLIGIALIVLFLAVATVFVFSFGKAKRMRQSFFNKLMFRTMLNFLLPLVTGGVFCMALLLNGYVGIIAPAMLLFYGLSLVNASKFTYGSLFWLGCGELLLGIACALFPGKGLLFWSLGFGALHIVYGIYFFLFIEKKK